MEDELIMNNEMNNEITKSVTLQSHLAKTFLWVFAGLLITALSVYVTLTTGLYLIIFTNTIVYIGIVVGEIALVIFLSSRIHKMSYTSAIISFIGYAVLTGLTFSILCLAYSPATIALAFGFSAFLFLDLAFIGMTTKFDLSNIFPLLFGGLIMMVIITVAGVFLDLSAMDVGICLFGIVVFLGLTAYDTQRIKHNYEYYRDDSQMLSKLTIYSALELYLDFINIFIYVLRLLGRSRN